MSGPVFDKVDPRVSFPKLEEKIAELNKGMNDTYVPYGAKGAEGKAKQEEQDRNRCDRTELKRGNRVEIKKSHARNHLPSFSGSLPSSACVSSTSPKKSFETSSSRPLDPAGGPTKPSVSIISKSRAERV